MHYYLLYTLDILVTDKTIEIKNLGPWLLVNVVIVLYLKFGPTRPSNYYCAYTRAIVTYKIRLFNKLAAYTYTFLLLEKIFE